MTKKTRIRRFYAFLSSPLFLRARIALALLVIPLGVAISQPLWHIDMRAPQYRHGLSLVIYSHTIEGGNDGADIKEINILNHYIGMKPLNRDDLTDLDWIPFALGLMVVLTLRCAAIGTVRSLIDIVVLTHYVGLFSVGRFVYRMYSYGHNLNPDAPVTIEPFTPVILGTKQIANFTTESYPGTGTYLIGFFAIGTVGLVLWHLFAGRKRALMEIAREKEQAEDRSEDRPSLDTDL